MGTRSGDLDPGVLIYLLRNERFDADKLEQLLNHASGLFALSSGESDVKVLEERAKSDASARLALDIFATSVRKTIGAYIALLGGIDLLVFTGGIGENSPDVRARICSGMEWAGLHLDANKNQETVGREGTISSEDSKLLAYAIPTDEELLIARDTVRVILGEPHPS